MKLLFCETPYVDEPYFEHEGEDMFKLYSISDQINDIPFDKICLELFLMSAGNIYKLNKINQQKKELEYRERAEELNERNLLISDRFKQEGPMIFGDILCSYLTDLEDIHMPDEFNILIQDCRFISHQADFIGIVLVGFDGCYYYFEYFGEE